VAEAVIGHSTFRFGNATIENLCSNLGFKTKRGGENKMNCPEIFKNMGLDPIKLHGSLIGQTKEELFAQFNDVLSQPGGQQHSGIVYSWASERAIPRLRGESNIIYIGRTVQTFRKRYSRGRIVEEFADWSIGRHKHIISTYGAIAFFLAPCDNPKGTEDHLLRAYYNDHLEAPPFNGSLPDLSRL
jgi:hypothetical protein